MLGKMGERMVAGDQKSKQSGQGLLEFVLILPVLVLIMFGALDLGRAFFVTINLQNAAREGARMVARNSNVDTNDVITRVKDEADGSGLDIGDDIQVTVTTTTNYDNSETIRVVATYDFYLLMGIIRTAPIEISRFAEMLIP
jgi:hypothetical protein